MNLSAFFAALAMAHALLLFFACRAGNGVAEWIVRALLAGLLYDNTVLALANSAIDAPWFYSASWMRYFLHVFVLPPLVVAALQLLGRAGVKWSGNRSALLFGAVFAVAGCGFGFATEIAGLELVQASLGEHVRFVSADAMPPLATIVSNVIVLVLAAILWKKSGWPWLFAATVTILLVNGSLAGNVWGIVAGNFAEVLFALAWVLSLIRFRAAPIDNNHMRA
jgi:hypothetical protein